MELKEGKDIHTKLRLKFCDVITQLIEEDPDTPVEDLLVAMSQLAASMLVAMDDDIGRSITWYIQNFITTCEQMAEARGLKVQMMVSHEGGKDGEQELGKDMPSVQAGGEAGSNKVEEEYRGG